VVEVTTASPASPQSQRRTGYKLSNMLIALGVMFGIVILAVLIVPRRSYEAVKVVETSDVIRSAQRTAPYAVLVPAGLQERWRPTSARVTTPNRPGDPTTMHIGYVTPLNEFAALEESNELAVPFIRLMTQGGKYDGTVVVNHVAWVRLYSKQRDVHSLIHATEAFTTVVTGTASYAELTELATSLH
jgi:Protein of unknown function (DUF4245)